MGGGGENMVHAVYDHSDIWDGLGHSKKHQSISIA